MHGSIRLAATFHPKAKLWSDGRKNWAQKLRENIDGQSEWIWFHCSSMGEFEDGRVLLEMIKKNHPDYKILLSFYSPSGFEARKNYEYADYVCYLASDTKANAKKWLDILQPKMAIFLRHELWYHFQTCLENRKIPSFLLSVRINQGSSFLKPFAKKLYQKIFHTFDHIFSENQRSTELLQVKFGLKSISTIGNTRIDRVLEVAQTRSNFPRIEEFIDDQFCVIAGSSLEKDEQLTLAAYLNMNPNKIKWMIVPHEIEENKITKIVNQYPNKMIRWSAIENDQNQLLDLAKFQILWIDCVGILASLYQYSHLAFIGGGFDKIGIHSILEPGAFAQPIVFGPNHRNYIEALEMIEDGNAIIIQDEGMLTEQIQRAFVDWQKGNQSIENRYLKKGAGASLRAYSYIKKNGYLN